MSKIGDVIKIKEEHVEIFQETQETIHSIKRGLVTLSEAGLSKGKYLFETASNLYPELKGFHYYYDSKRNTFVITDEEKKKI